MIYLYATYRKDQQATEPGLYEVNVEAAIDADTEKLNSLTTKVGIRLYHLRDEPNNVSIGTVTKP